MDLTLGLRSDENGFLVLLQALKGGACPNLSQLDVFGGCSPASFVKTLADVVEARKANPSCAGITKLRGSWPLYAEEADVLRIIKVCLPTLEEIDWWYYYRMEAVAQHILKAKHLVTKSAKLSCFKGRPHAVIPSTVAFIEAMSKNAPLVENVFIMSIVLPTSAMSHLTNAITRGMWPNLRQLWLPCCVMRSVDLMRLADALSSSSRTLNLREIRISVQRSVGLENEWIKSLARSFGQGGCAKLEILQLECGRIGDDGLLALKQAWDNGAPCAQTLQEVGLSDEYRTR